MFSMLHARFSACNIEKLGRAWGRGYGLLSLMAVSSVIAARKAAQPTMKGHNNIIMIIKSIDRLQMLP